MRGKHILFSVFKKALIVSLILSLVSAYNLVYAASDTGETGQKQDIIDESRAQREKLRQSIDNARAVLDSSSATGSSEDSLSVIRHTNGAAPSNYKPHGKLYSPKYDASKIYSTTYASAAPEPAPSQTIAQTSSVPVNVLDTTSGQQQTTVPQNNTGSAGSAPVSSASSTSSISAAPITSSAPITESSNPAMSEKVKAVYNLIPENIRKDYENNGWVIKIAPQ